VGEGEVPSAPAWRGGKKNSSYTIGKKLKDETLSSPAQRRRKRTKDKEDVGKPAEQGPKKKGRIYNAVKKKRERNLLNRRQ